MNSSMKRRRLLAWASATAMVATLAETAAGLLGVAAAVPAGAQS